MTARPQPMAGQPDAADDLIAELAKLMAQDAQGSKPVAPEQKPAFSVRIPGEDKPPVAPAPRFDFTRTPEPAGPPAASAPAPAEVSTPPAAAPASSGPRSTPAESSSSAGGYGRSSQGKEPTPPPAAPAAPVASPPAAPAEEHDSIADLIAAELAAETPATPVQAADTHPGARVGSWTAAPVEAPPVTATEPSGIRREPDRFGVPPVFGLTGGAAAKSAPVAPVVAPKAAAEPVAPGRDAASGDGFGNDPIDEIESLIGRAMRVEFDKPAEPLAPAATSTEKVDPEVETADTRSPAGSFGPADRPAPSPALRSLATPTIPQPEPPAPVGKPARQLSAADEAILAAAEASGADIGWVEAPEVDNDLPPPRRSSMAFGFTRTLAGPLVAVVLLLAAGFGLYWVLGLGREPGPAPLLTAEATPVKETPEVQPDPGAAQQSVVFNEMAGVVPGAEEQLVSRDQADVNEVTQMPPADVSEEGLANRKVRTVTVRPDGTIVSGEDSVAGSAILPVDRPNVPEVPGAATASPELLAGAEPAAAATADPDAPTAEVTPTTEIASATAVAPATPETVPAATVAPVEPGSTVPVVDASGTIVPGKTAPVPLQKPTFSAAALAAASQPTSPVNAVVDTPIAAPASGLQSLPPPPGSNQLAAPPVAQPQASAAPAQTAAAPAPADAAPAYVQLSSQRTEEAARSTAQDIANRFGPLFNGASLEVQRVDLGARGIFYRVRVPANSLQEANALCASVKTNGGDCFTM